MAACFHLSPRAFPGIFLWLSGYLLRSLLLTSLAPFASVSLTLSPVSVSVGFTCILSLGFSPFISLFLLFSLYCCLCFCVLLRSVCISKFLGLCVPPCLNLSVSLISCLPLLFPFLPVLTAVSLSLCLSLPSSVFLCPCLCLFPSLTASHCLSASL